MDDLFGKRSTPTVVCLPMSRVGSGGLNEIEQPLRNWGCHGDDLSLTTKISIGAVIFLC
jgi:hypothetical protein